jgi:transcriptional regulator
MYLPKHYEETDVGVLHGLEANHIPFLARAEPEPYGSLHGHIARANPLWRNLAPDVQALMIFQGPQTFISPSWYPSKKETAKVVPTWNYAVVHARGHIRVIDDPAWVRTHVKELTNRHEAERPAPWKVSDAPADFIEKMIAAVVGLEIPIASLSGKWKVSQNRLPRDREGVIEGLKREGTDVAAAMASLVRQALSSTRGDR